MEWMDTVFKSRQGYFENGIGGSFSDHGKVSREVCIMSILSIEVWINFKFEAQTSIYSLIARNFDFAKSFCSHYCFIVEKLISLAF